MTIFPKATNLREKKKRNFRNFLIRIANQFYTNRFAGDTTDVTRCWADVELVKRSLFLL